MLKLLLPADKGDFAADVVAVNVARHLVRVPIGLKLRALGKDKSDLGVGACFKLVVGL